MGAETGDATGDAMGVLVGAGIGTAIGLDTGALFDTSAQQRVRNKVEASEHAVVLNLELPPV